MAGLESAGLTIGNRGIWCARLDSNQHCTAFEAAASAVGLRAHGRLGRIRTDPGRGLSALPLPGWATSLWCSGRDSNSQQCGSQPHASCQVAPPEHWWAVKDSNLGCFPKGYRGYSPALSASQPTAQTRIVKDLAEGRRLERLCPEGPWLSKPVGYQLPEPSGHKLKM